MKIAGIEIIESVTLGDGQMLVHSNGLVYGWDFGKEGSCCIVAKPLPNGRLEIVEITYDDIPPADQERTK